MLTSDLIKPQLRFAGSTLSVEMVDEDDLSLQQTAQELITLLQCHKGDTQAAWEEAMTAYEGDRVDYIVVRGLAKVLTDATTFTPLTLSPPSTALREQVFAHGPVFRSTDIFRSQTRQDVFQTVADELTLCAEQIEDHRFADRPAQYRLTDTGPAWTPLELLMRYNLELARGVLYWAVLSELRTQKRIREQRILRCCCLSLGGCLYRFLQGCKPIKKSSSPL
jgi:predicted nuclease of restriction endonuclease-like RecB superfamily